MDSGFCCAVYGAVSVTHTYHHLKGGVQTLTLFSNHLVDKRTENNTQ